MVRQRIKLYRHLPIKLPSLSWPMLFLFGAFLAMLLALEPTSVMSADDRKAMSICGVLLGLAALALFLLDWLINACDDFPSKYKLGLLDKIFLRYLQNIDSYEISMFCKWIEENVRFITHFYIDNADYWEENNKFRVYVNETETGQATISLNRNYVLNMLYKNIEHLAQVEIEYNGRAEKYYINSIPVLFLLWLKVENKYDKVLITFSDVIYQNKPYSESSKVRFGGNKIVIKQTAKAVNNSNVVQAAIINNYGVSGCGSSTIDNYAAGWGAGSSGRPDEPVGTYRDLGPDAKLKMYSVKSIIKEDNQKVIDIKNVTPVPLGKCEYAFCILFVNKIMLTNEQDFVLDRYNERIVLSSHINLPKDTVISMNVTYKEK